MTNTSSTYDVFLSHNAADKARVRRLAERLRDAGLSVWFDEWVVTPGDDIYLAIDRGLEAARVQILCLSPAALGSDWVALERNTVLFRDPANKHRRFVPLLLADCKLPDTLRRYKYVDFRGESDEAFAELLATCTSTGWKKIGVAGFEHSESPDRVGLRRTQLPSKRKTIGITVLLVIVVGTGIVFLSRHLEELADQIGQGTVTSTLRKTISPINETVLPSETNNIGDSGESNETESEAKEVTELPERVLNVILAPSSMRFQSLGDRDWGFYDTYFLKASDGYSVKIDWAAFTSGYLIEYDETKVWLLYNSHQGAIVNDFIARHYSQFKAEMIDLFRESLDEPNAELIFNSARGFSLSYKDLMFFIRKNEDGFVSSFKVIKQNVVLFSVESAKLKLTGDIDLEFSKLYKDLEKR
uniref:TIR domain-containing protein n=1 Tax=Candidatus Kentrum eta TaxID=2126337 RepID=A0A450VJR1_9GAMM|nr:MAG: TIR domain-containing protein [Candidatus Kentron sp. H]VFK01517.1 MAG: TIR domain-containing protein [Candidatus Kentron sp. H]VFK05049.1 MAG: TIR domain-containing protein [Candidatus Kentron sp. H]